MHIIERFFHEDTTGNKSKVKDFRDHVSMAVQLKGLNGGTATIHGTLFENKNYIPVTIECLGSATITQDGIYTVSPRFRYYYMTFNRANPTPFSAYLYAVKAGAFWQADCVGTDTGGGNGFLDDLRENGDQKDIRFHRKILTDTMDVVETSTTILAAKEAYIHHVNLDVKGHGGAHVQIIKKIGAVEEVLNQYILHGGQPTINDPIYFLDKLNLGANDATIVIRAKKLIYNYDTCLYGRVTYIEK